jgi:RNA polymerase sigma-70 factor (ECF subfamily)
MLYRRKLLHGDDAEQIITELYEQGHNLADMLIEQILGTQLSRDEREDLIQEGFLRLITHVEDLSERSLSGRLSYMSSTMRNLAIDEGRRRTKQRLMGLLDMIDDESCREISSNELSPEEHFLMKEDREDRKRRLEEALNRLKPRDMALLIERYGEERSDREIGERLGIKPENVRTYMDRARKRLADIYQEEE